MKAVYSANNKVSIFLDMDGVLADTHHELLKRYNEEYGENIVKEDIKEWDLNKVTKPNTSIIKYFEEPGFFRSVPVYKGAREAVKVIKSIRCVEMFIASTSTSNGFKDKEDWIQENFPEIQTKNIIFTSRKDVLMGDILVDDGLHNLENSKCGNLIIFDQPWNRTGNIPNRAMRIKSWEELVDNIYRIIQIKQWLENGGSERRAGIHRIY